MRGLTTEILLPFEDGEPFTYEVNRRVDHLLRDAITAHSQEERQQTQGNRYHGDP